MVGNNPLNFKDGTKIQLKTKISDSETPIPELHQGEPLFNTNDNRLYIGPEYSEGNTNPKVPDAKTTFMPMQGIKDEYEIKTVYDDDGNNDGIFVKTSKIDVNIPEIIVSDLEDNPLVTISDSADKTSIHTADVQIDGDLNITGEGTGKLSFTNSGAVFVGDYDASHLHAGIRFIKNEEFEVDIHSDDKIDLKSDNINLEGTTSITGSLRTNLDPMITVGETQPWYVSGFCSFFEECAVFVKQAFPFLCSRVRCGILFEWT